MKHQDNLQSYSLVREPEFLLRYCNKYLHLLLGRQGYQTIRSTHSETIDKTQFYVYDIYGRGYSIDVTGTGTISSFDGTTVVIGANVAQFGDATDTNKKLIAVEKAGTSNIEFMLYDNKSSSSLTISDRVLYTGLGHTFANNDVIYALDVPMQLVRNNDEELENLL